MSGGIWQYVNWALKLVHEENGTLEPGKETGNGLGSDPCSVCT